MDQVYSRASSVVVWLGLEAEDSNIDVQAIRDHVQPELGDLEVSNGVAEIGYV